MTSPRRVCHVFPYDPRHLGLGFPRWSASQLERWPLAAVAASRLSRRSTVHVIGPRGRRRHEPPLEVFEHVSLTSGPGWRDWGDDWSVTLRRMLAHLRGEDVCVIHLNDYPAARLVQHAASGCRTVIVFHGRGVGRFDEYLARADRLVVLRHDAASALVQAGARPEQVAVLVPSVDRRRFAPPPEPAGFADPRPVLGFVGRLEPSKGVLEIPAVLARLAAAGTRARAELVGPASAAQQAEFDQAAARAGVQERVELLGELPGDQLALRMRRWRVLLLPSYTEGYPLVAQEACACRVPVAAVAGVLPAELEERPGVHVAPREGYPRLVARLLAEDSRPPADDRVIAHEAAGAQWDALLEALPAWRPRAPLPPPSRLRRLRRLRPIRRVARAALGRRR